MARPMIDFPGGNEIARALSTLSVRISRKVQLEALETAAEPMRRRMATLAPREPGPPDLRDAFVVQAVRGSYGSAATVAVGPARTAYYGSFQEFGTAHHGAQPFARPAFDETATDVIEDLGAAFWTELAGRGVHRSVRTNEGPVTGGPGGGLL